MIMLKNLLLEKAARSEPFSIVINLFSLKLLERREEKTMKKTEMLKKNYEFKNVLSKGKYFSGRNMEAFIKINNKNTNFLGIAISSKIAKSVERNKIKRLIRENYRIIENDVKDGYDIVFLWKKSVEAGKANYEIVNKDIKKILEKAKIFEEKI